MSRLGVLGAMRGPSGTGPGALGVAQSRRLKAARNADVIAESSGPGDRRLEAKPLRETKGAAGLISNAGGPSGERTSLEGAERVEIEAGPGTVSGSGGQPAARTDGAIRQVVAKWARTFQACYERSLKLDPALRGRVWLEFTIGAAGKVTRVSINSGDIDVTIGGLDRCLTRWFDKMQFGPAADDVDCRYPLMLTPE
ncbi:MAG: hypothetical protein CME06_07600 [Gemmatimonadetes bacterium]|nr:hypothetical protein [Gemmatimonadota bacterium]